MLIFLLGLPLAGQSLSKDQIKDRIKANEALEGDAKAEKATAVWNEALVELEAAEDTLKMEAKALEDLKRLDKPLSLPVPAKLPADAPRADYEALFKKVEALLETNETLIREINDQASQSPKLGVTLTAEIEMLKGQLRDLEIPAATTGQLEAAQYQKAVQKKDRIEAKLKELSAKKDFNDKAASLFDSRIAAAKKQSVGLRELSKELEERIQKFKEEEAKETREAISELKDEFESIPEFAKIVKELNEIRTGQDRVEGMLAKARTYDDRVEEIGNSIEKQYAAAKQRISLLEEADLGVDDETGMLLRRQRARLPSVDEISKELRVNLELMAKAEIDLLEVTDALKDLKVIPEDQIEEVLKNHPKITRKRVDELIQRRSDALMKLSAEYRELNKELTKATSAAERTIADIKIYSQFIDERLLWIKSAKPIHWREPVDEWNHIISGSRQSVRHSFTGI